MKFAMLFLSVLLLAACDLRTDQTFLRPSPTPTRDGRVPIPLRTGDESNAGGADDVEIFRQRALESARQRKAGIIPTPMPMSDDELRSMPSDPHVIRYNGRVVR